MGSVMISGVGIGVGAGSREKEMSIYKGYNDDDC